jgi:SNF2 family DNA or RNA helicase
MGIIEVMICPKSMFERKDNFENLLQCKWKIVIIDEFHAFKNEKGHLATNLRMMRDTIECVVVGLTGTIMQNHHKELWNLIDLASKNFLGPWSEFEAKYARPIKLARYVK